MDGAVNGSKPLWLTLPCDGLAEAVAASGVVLTAGVMIQTAAAIPSALRTLEIEVSGLAQLSDALKGPLGAPFSAAVALIAKCSGRVIISGMGKSGLIGRKIAATFASTGTPAYFVHPGEASHGDLGMIRADDVILALSWSGITATLA